MSKTIETTVNDSNGNIIASARFIADEAIVPDFQGFEEDHLCARITDIIEKIEIQYAAIGCATTTVITAD